MHKVQWYDMMCNSITILYSLEQVKLITTMLLSNAHKQYDKVIHQIIRISVLVDRGKGWSTESG